ncbi:MAG: thioredoxin family protein [Pseudomonadota bacterium]
MVKTASNMMPLGTQAPEFSLLDTVTGNTLSLHSIKGEYATLIMFICNHCPFVKHVDRQLAKLGREYVSKGVGILAISSNDVSNYPEDSPEKMQQLASSLGFNFPYLYDETQEVAKLYDAACTPDFYIFDAELKCVYRGQLDDSRPGNDIPVNGSDVRNALDCTLAGRPISDTQKPSVGCNIKWK